MDTISSSRHNRKFKTTIKIIRALLLTLCLANIAQPIAAMGKKNKHKYSKLPSEDPTLNVADTHLEPTSQSFKQQFLMSANNVDIHQQDGREWIELETQKIYYSKERLSQAILRGERQKNEKYINIINIIREHDLELISTQETKYSATFTFHTKYKEGWCPIRITIYTTSSRLSWIGVSLLYSGFIYKDLTSWLFPFKKYIPDGKGNYDPMFCVSGDHEELISMLFAIK